METLKTYYELLEVSEMASTETIRATYRSLSKRFHPDNKKTGDAERFRLITEAHDCLIDEEKRRTYDRELTKSRKPKREARTTESAEKKTRARQEKDAHSVPSFDPAPGVEALFQLGAVVMGHYEVEPIVQTVFMQLRPDLQNLTTEAVKRMVAR